MTNKNLELFAQMLSEEIKKTSIVQQEGANFSVSEETPPQITITEDSTAMQISKYLTQKSKTDARDTSIEANRWNDPLNPPDQKFVTMKEMNEHYGLFLKRIQQQMSTMSGGGEVRLSRLDDVDRASIVDEGYLNYDASTGKFVFSKLPSVTTASVTEATYTLTSTDSYIGVNRAGAVEITLPSVGVVDGRLLYIKDESGAAETNPITVLGTVDNDAGGFVLQINNGSITLIYRDGWRIV